MERVHRRRWTWQIGRIAGIAVYIHATFVLLLAWIAVVHVAAGHDLATTLRGFVLVAAVFAVVVVHELSHALVARRFGIPTRDITLYPIGGIARLERMPEKPAQELLVAIAGPLTNAVLAGAIFIGLELAGAGADGDPLSLGASFAVQLMWINILLGGFNLIPAFPMDGGRVLRALLSFWMTRSRATAVAARVGRAIAVVFALVGILWSPMLALIAVFVWITAGQENAIEQLKSSLHGLSVGDAMVGEFKTLPATVPVEIAVGLLASGFQHDFPIVDHDQIVGMLTRGDVLRGLQTGRTTPVGDLMHTSFPIAGWHEPLDAVLERMQDGTSVLVLRDERPVGLLDPAHVDDVLALHAPA